MIIKVDMSFIYKYPLLVVAFLYANKFTIAGMGEDLQLIWDLAITGFTLVLVLSL